MLNHRRELPSLGITIGDAMEPYLYFNWRTSGIILDYHVKATKRNISMVTDIAIRLSEDDLVISEEAFNQEIQVIEYENTNPQWSDNPWRNINKHYKWLKSIDDSTVKEFSDLHKLYDDIITNNRATVIFWGDLNDKNVIKAIEKLRNWLNSKKVDKREFDWMYESLPYVPAIQEKDAVVDFQSLDVSFSFEEVNKDIFVYYYFFIIFFSFVLEEFVREIEQSDYWVKRSYRTCTYSALQLVFTMHSASPTSVLLDLADNFFHKSKEDFENLKNRIIEKEETYIDDPESFYQIIHSQYFYRGKYHSVDLLVESLHNIEYEDFYEFYKKAIKRMSIDYY